MVAAYKRCFLSRSLTRVALLVALLAPGQAAAQLCTLAWDAPMAYTDGSPIGPEEIRGYRLKISYTSGGPYTLVEEVPTPETTFDTLCEPRTYWIVTAVSIADRESAPSNELQIRKRRPQK